MNASLSGHFSYKRLLKFILPAIGMMLFSSIYSVVDGFFVSNYAGSSQFAAINLIIPFLILVAAVGFMIGSGGTALVSYHLGTGNKERANNTFSLLTYTVIFVGLIFTIFGQLVLEEVSIFLGATGDMLPYCILYGRIVLSALIPFMLQNMFQSFMVAAGKPKLGFGVTVFSGITNMLLDYILVGIFSLGVSGAAIATAMSQLVGGVIPLIYFLLPNKSLLQLSKVSFDLASIIKACSNGASEFVTNISMSIVSMLYNRELIDIAGENGVSAYGVIMYVSFIFVAVFIGYSIGVVPVIGYNYGAGNNEELKSLLKKSLLTVIFAGVIMFILSEISAQQLAHLFVGYDIELMEITKAAFRIYASSFLIVGLNIFVSAFFTALSDGKISAIISFSRTLVFQVIIVIVLPMIFGIKGIWWATTIAELLAAIISLYYLVKMKNKYNY
ncbi:MAG: MATE family efflux transporter [Lachnospiraceae bacterium]|nr:MATE family efflux transporter [Lachnospiraceae bacterium]